MSRRSRESETMRAAMLVAMTLGVCFSFLAISLETAIGGDVPLAIKFGPVLGAGALTAIVALDGRGTPSESVGESASEQPEPEATNL